MNPELPLPPDCAGHQESLNRFLDGDAGAFSRAETVHRVSCPTCQSEHLAARRLQLLLERRDPINLPGDARDRLVAIVMNDRPTPWVRRTLVARRVISVLAVAACVTLALAFVVRWAERPRRDVLGPASPSAVALVPKPTPVTLDGSLTDAGAAIASLTRRTAEQTIEPARKLLASSADATRFNADPLPGTLEPATQSLSEIRQGAVAGFEPVTRSASRAVSMFLRELPIDGERKSGL